MKISVVIPNYNGFVLLKKNIPRLLSVLPKTKEHDFEVIVVDDGSKDESVSWLRDKFPSITIIRNKTNRGFAVTVNRGVEIASGELVILLNTDVYPQDNFLDSAIPHFEKPRVFAVGFMDKSYENGTTVLRGRGIGWWERGFYLHKRGDVDKTDTSWVSGGSCIFRRDIFLKLHGFDEAYVPFYWEDIDLSYRAVKAGYLILFEPCSVVVHEHSKGSILSQYSPGEVKRISYRNQFLFVWKNATTNELLRHFLWLPYHIVRSLVSGNTLLLTGMAAAIWRYCTHNKQTT